MADLQSMIDAIADEIQRDDLDGQIRDKIQQAIKYYQRTAFYSSDKQSTVPTVNGTQNYTYPTDVAWFRKIWITVSGTRYSLIPRSFEYLISEDTQITNPTKGRPIEYAVFGGDIYLFPRPVASTYTITYDYVQKVPAPATAGDVNDTATNFWTNDAEAIVRNRAKALIYAEVTHEPQLAQTCFERAKDEEVELREETAAKKWTGSVMQSS